MKAVAQYDNAATAPRKARVFVGNVLRRADLASATEVALLLLSELVTNAVRHGDSEVSVTVNANRDSVRIAVTDRSPGEPHLTDAAPLDDGGRGLFMVASLASRWGISPVRDGKVVWFDLDVPTDAREQGGGDDLIVEFGTA